MQSNDNLKVVWAGAGAGIARLNTVKNFVRVINNLRKNTKLKKWSANFKENKS